MRIGNFYIGTEPQMRSFGLRQAEGAMKFAKDPAQVGAVLGVVVGVLGYQNTVAADVAAADEDQRVNIGTSKSGISTAEKTIAALKQEIASLEGEIKVAADRRAQLAEVAKLFGGK